MNQTQGFGIVGGGAPLANWPLQTDAQIAEAKAQAARYERMRVLELASKYSADLVMVTAELMMKFLDGASA